MVNRESEKGRIRTCLLNERPPRLKWGMLTVKLSPHSSCDMTIYDLIGEICKIVRHYFLSVLGDIFKSKNSGYSITVPILVT